MDLLIDLENSVHPPRQMIEALRKRKLYIIVVFKTELVINY